MSDRVPRRLQVLLLARPGGAVVAGLPCAVRAAYRAGRELLPERIVVAGADAAYLAKWTVPLRASGTPLLGAAAGPAALDPRLPLLAVDPEAFPDEGGIAAFLDAAERSGAVRRLVAGRLAAVYVRDAAALGAGSMDPVSVHARALLAPGADVDAGAFFDARGPLAAAAAAAALYARLGKPNDGYIARFDRVLSIALTRLMLPFPITPNQVTAASLVVGLAGAWGLAAPSRAAQFAGALALWLCALLDGCDGEIARLKLNMTPWGGEFDLLADHIAHLATFVALPIGVARLHPGQDWRVPGVLLVTGFLACGWFVWRLVLRVPESERGPQSLAVERVASRDYVYLILLCTALGRLDWFVWAAAVGSHVFWIWLVASTRRASGAPSLES